MDAALDVSHYSSLTETTSLVVRPRQCFCLALGIRRFQARASKGYDSKTIWACEPHAKLILALWQTEVENRKRLRILQIPAKRRERYACNYSSLHYKELYTRPKKRKTRSERLQFAAVEGFSKVRLPAMNKLR